MRCELADCGSFDEHMVYLDEEHLRVTASLVQENKAWCKEEDE